MLGNVGTIKATTNSAEAITSYSEHEVFLLNVFGEFNFYKNNQNKIKIIDIFNFLDFLPSTGIISKLSIYLFTILSIPLIIYNVIKHKPNIIISNLVGYLPLILKFFFKDIKIFNSIQGYPRFTFIRTIIWKFLYVNSDLIITMTDLTKKKIQKKFPKIKNIIQINNPIIDENLFKSSNILLDSDLKKYLKIIKLL